jgi:glyoxalase family protein
MPNPIPGLHHITAMAGSPQRNLDFYSRVLGQRLVKTTVNFDDPGTYHLYYGDEVGTPGTIMTFFPWSNAKRGTLGNSETAATAYSIPRDSLPYWRERLEHLGVSEGTRFGETVLTFTDPDGMRLELITQDALPEVRHWVEGPVPQEHALRGFHSVTLWVGHAKGTARLLTQHLGFEPSGEAQDAEGTRYRFKAPGGAAGTTIDLVERPGRFPGRLGTGSIHHIALRARNDREQNEWLEALSSAGFNVTTVQDRQYFHSVYFREPGGVLFEIATDNPGFTTDEPVETLGRQLKLPSWLEPVRERIETKLPLLDITKAEKAYERQDA